MSESDGVYTWGSGMFGQLGTDISVSGKTARNVPERVLSRHFGGCAALMVACGLDFTVLVNAAGQVWTCGDGQHGQLGLGDHRDLHSFPTRRSSDLTAPLSGGLGGASLTSDE